MTVCHAHREPGATPTETRSAPDAPARCDAFGKLRIGAVPSIPIVGQVLDLRAGSDSCGYVLSGGEVRHRCR